MAFEIRPCCWQHHLNYDAFANDRPEMDGLHSECERNAARCALVKRSAGAAHIGLMAYGLASTRMQLVTLQYHARLYRSARWLMLLRCSASPVGQFREGDGR